MFVWILLFQTKFCVSLKWWICHWKILALIKYVLRKVLWPLDYTMEFNIGKSSASKMVVSYFHIFPHNFKIQGRKINVKLKFTWIHLKLICGAFCQLNKKRMIFFFFFFPVWILLNCFYKTLLNKFLAFTNSFFKV